MRIVYSYQGKQLVFDRETTQVVIGRPKEGLAVDLDLTPDKAVSRPHARVWVEDDQYWIEDLNSVRGTLVGGELIRGKGKRRLHAGDTIRVGETTLSVDILAMEVDRGPTPTPEMPVAEPPVDIAQTLDASMPAFAAEDAPTTDPARRLALLYELPLQLAQETRLDTLLQKIVERLVEIIPGAGRGALLVKDQRTGDLLLKAHMPPGEPAVSMTLARRAMEQRQGFVWQRGEQDLSFSISQQNIESGMYAPLLWKGETLGVLCVDSCNTCLALGSDDLRLMLAVAHHAAMAVATHQLREDLRRNAALLGRLLTNFSPKIRERLLEKARHGRLRLGGEKSEVTILFSDIRGFTHMSAGMEAEDIVDMLNDYFPAQVDAIFGNDGTIDKFVGDAILAVFGSPEPDTKQHEKAVRAALAIQAAITELNKARTSRGQVNCGISVGVHCGEVLHGFIGTPDRMEFTVIGDAVNRASRYCAGANAGEVLISPEMHERVWRMIQAERTTISTKHEGEFIAYRVKCLKDVPTA